MSLRIGEEELTVELPEKFIDGDKTLQPMIPFPGGEVTVTAPGNWALKEPTPGVKLTKSAAGCVLDVPAGVTAVTLMKGT